MNLLLLWLAQSIASALFSTCRKCLLVSRETKVNKKNASFYLLIVCVFLLGRSPSAKKETFIGFKRQWSPRWRLLPFRLTARSIFAWISAETPRNVPKHGNNGTQEPSQLFWVSNAFVRKYCVWRAAPTRQCILWLLYDHVWDLQYDGQLAWQLQSNTFFCHLHAIIISGAKLNLTFTANDKCRTEIWLLLNLN